MRNQHTVIGFLLTSYLIVGAIAHLEDIGRLFCYDSRPQKVEQGRPTQPPPETVCWTQYKHIPSFTKILLATPEASTLSEWAPLEQSAHLPVPQDVRIQLFRETISFLSRAPPFSLQ